MGGLLAATQPQPASLSGRLMSVTGPFPLFVCQRPDFSLMTAGAPSYRWAVARPLFPYADVIRANAWRSSADGKTNITAESPAVVAGRAA